jgi:hypothetical protein
MSIKEQVLLWVMGWALGVAQWCMGRLDRPKAAAKTLTEVDPWQDEAWQADVLQVEDYSRN